MSNAWKDFRNWFLGILGKPDKNSNRDNEDTLKSKPDSPSNATASERKGFSAGLGPGYDDPASEDQTFDAGEKTPVLEHSNPVIRRVLDAISREESLEVLYVIEMDRPLAPKSPRKYEYRTIKPLEVFNSGAWTKSMYIEAESKGDVKTFRADRMALLNSDGTISIGGEVLCSSWDCPNGVSVHLGEGNLAKVDRFCTSCQLDQESSSGTEPDTYNDNENCGLSPDNDSPGVNTLKEEPQK